MRYVGDVIGVVCLFGLIFAAMWAAPLLDLWVLEGRAW